MKGEKAVTWFGFLFILGSLLAQEKAKISGREATKYRFLLPAFCSNW
jgi:hypothetical protein